MKINRVEIENYRSIKKASFDFNSLNVIIGRSNSGKSNLLRAIDFLLRWTKAQDYKEVVAYASGEAESFFTATIRDYAISYDNKPGKVKLKAEIELDSSFIDRLFPEKEIIIEEERIPKKEIGNVISITREVELKDGKKADFKLTSLSIELKNGNAIAIADESGKELRRTKEEGVYSYKGSGMLLSFTILTHLQNSFCFIPSYRNLRKEIITPEEPLEHGYGIPSYLLLGKDKEKIERIKKDFQEIFAEYQKIYADEDEDRRVDVFFADLPSSFTGDGAKNVFNIVFNFNFRDSDIFAIEEPEKSLSPSEQRKLANYIKKFTGKKQIFISTHSMAFARIAERLYFVYRKDNESFFSELKDKKIADNLFYEYIIFAEGEREKELQETLLKNGYRLEENGIKVYGFNSREGLKNLLPSLREFGIPYYLLIKEDDNAEEYIKELLKQELLEVDNWSMHVLDDKLVERIINKVLFKQI